MELKEYLKIFKKNAKLFGGIIVAAMLLVWGYFTFQPMIYDVSLTINIARSGSENTPDYRYDNFYRLQADEKFAETVVEWLKSPRIVMDILVSSEENQPRNLKNLSGFFEAEKRSSQIVAIKFSAPSQTSAKKISENIKKILSGKTEKLNEAQKEANWFLVLFDDPVIIRRNYDSKILILAGFLSGIFLGFWVVMTKHYLE